MFFRKRKYTDNVLGELVYGSRSWVVQICSTKNKELYIEVSGSKEAPHKTSLSQAKFLLEIISKKEIIATEYVDFVDISEYQKDAGDLVLVGFLCSENNGEYDLFFSLSEWDDAEIIVHFKGDEPYAISLGD
ncbi:MAG: hypothetical protein ACRBHB_16310 [Arenicella sp.]